MLTHFLFNARKTVTEQYKSRCHVGYIFASSLKDSTWEQRRRIFQESVWADQASKQMIRFFLLRDPTYKNELFAFLTSMVEKFTCPPSKSMYYSW